MAVDICFGCMKEKIGEGACPHCGFDADTYQSELHHLHPGSVLNGKYLVGRVLGEGGFGITYVGFDLNLQMKVAIKEYYPNGYVTRTEMNTGQVTVLTGKKSEYFYKGQEQFVEEARRLAKFWGLPGIVAVKDYFQENGTAYIVMEFVEGETLKELLARNEGCMKTEELLELIRPVMKSLQKIHEGGLIHRDISPDNMMMDKDGNVKLLDFGAARSFIAESEKSLSVILKPGFAPEEQYRSRGNQGPWTDVYALCATIYRAITGKVPVESLDRLVGDDLPLPSTMGVSLSAQQEAALMKGLAVLEKDRFRSVKELEEALYDGVPVTDAVTRPESKTIAVNEPEIRAKEKKMQASAEQKEVPGQKKNKKPAVIGATAAVAVGVIAAFLYMNTEYSVTVTGGVGTAKYKAGAEVTIIAEDREAQGYRFAGWIVDKSGKEVDIADASAVSTSFIMPNGNVSIEAVYEILKFDLSVQGAEGSGSYEAGSVVTLKAEDLSAEGYRFVGWKGLDGIAGVDDTSKLEISFEMPEKKLEVEACYEKEIVWSDPQFGHAVQMALGYSSADEIQLEELVKVTDLTIIKDKVKITLENGEVYEYENEAVELISGLEDLKYFTGLEWLTISMISLDDLEPIGQLTGLKHLDVGIGGVTDDMIAPLVNLTELESLSLSSNEISDVTPLRSLTGLTHLTLTGNNISNIDALESLVNLEFLSLAFNENLSDISVVSSMKKMGLLNLDNTSVRDISALQGLNELYSLGLENTYVEDLSPVSHIPDLELEHSVKETEEIVKETEEFDAAALLEAWLLRQKEE